ncbi:MAG: MoxR family ATPase [Nanoarchaeota archaeon]|nr:MoxR family ATPase [Nanoarchaeota archaeon]MBU1270492.1 MoxR family ATPase [Nanoarchaeota archaeon]MBU1603870.1 MoxR family ATPase [Nanoarchaeota archaeon]MBU2442721.1 MoxR family ATPase [Nanoarchaeota archaeon]
MEQVSKKKVHENKNIDKEIKELNEKINKTKGEMRKVLIGQEDILISMFEALLANGHVLVEGIPGTGKTLLVRTLSQVSGSMFSRIQFTPDLLPTDILGITTYEEGKGFYTVKGPIFANFVLADEINRSPPKVQSALLEGMQERQVTIGKETFKLPNPFIVMATQNPLEQLGTYKLPEAQVDRFLYKLIIGYPTAEEEIKIINTNITTRKFEDFGILPILSPTDITNAQELVKRIYCDEKIQQYIIRIVEATRNYKKYNIEKGKFIEYGASPRSSISLFISAKAHAVIKGRSYVTQQDVKDIARHVLRHRILINFEGEAENISSDDIITEIINKVPVL